MRSGQFNLFGAESVCVQPYSQRISSCALQQICSPADFHLPARSCTLPHNSSSLRVCIVGGQFRQRCADNSMPTSPLNETYQLGVLFVEVYFRQTDEMLIPDGVRALPREPGLELRVCLCFSRNPSVMESISRVGRHGMLKIVRCKMRYHARRVCRVRRLLERFKFTASYTSVLRTSMFRACL